MLHKVVDNIYCIDLDTPGNPLRNLNVYLVLGGERNLLIDTAFKFYHCRSRIQKALDELGVSMDNTDIFLTHYHADHTGLAMALAKEGTRIYISDTDRRLLETTVLDNGRQEYCGNLNKLGFPEDEEKELVYYPFSDFAVLPFGDFCTVSDGDELCCGDFCFTAIATPGHSPGHMCLYEKRLKLMFLGDCVINGITPSTSVPEGEDCALKAYFESLEKLKGYEIDYALPAHRELNFNVAERAEQLEQIHRLRLREIVDILTEHPDLSPYETASYMKWRVMADRESWKKFNIDFKRSTVDEAYSHLLYLRCHGVVEEHECDGRVRYGVASES